MIETLITHEGGVRLSVFITILLLMVLAEAQWPKRERRFTRLQRWTANSLLVVVDTLILRLVLPVLALGVAAYASKHGIGLFNILNLPEPVSLVASIIVLDGLIYGQHILMHKVPMLWALHQVHHTDLDFDATTALRFHPVEILVSMLIKMAAVLVLGVPVAAVILFEIVLNGMAMFNHSNLNLPTSVDRVLRSLMVTPDMHRVHHSVVPQEHDTNYGFNLSVWDRIFGTYRAQPEGGHRGMTIGLTPYQDDRPLGLLWLLGLPFMRRNRSNLDSA